MRRNTTKIRDLWLPFITGPLNSNACPAKSLLTYISRTDRFRSSNCDSLFLKHSNFSAVKPQSISFYVKECISCAYESVDISGVTGRAHDVRKMAFVL